MTTFYADSSALVKRHVQETGSAWIRSLADPHAGNTLTTARVTQVEVYSVLNRRQRESSISYQDYKQMVADFERLCWRDYELVELDSTISKLACALLERRALRAYDAIQLASALTAQRALAANSLPPLIFLAADNRLLTAAQDEGLLIDNPNLHP